MIFPVKAAMGLIGKGNKGGQSDTSKPFHTHDGDSLSGGGTTTTGTTKELGDSRFDPIIGDISRQDPSFMGKNQVDQFSSLIDPSSVDASGRTVLPGETLVQDVDEMGINSLY